MLEKTKNKKYSFVKISIKKYKTIFHQVVIHTYISLLQVINY